MNFARKQSDTIGDLPDALKSAVTDAALLKGLSDPKP